MLTTDVLINVLGGEKVIQHEKAVNELITLHTLRADRPQ